MPIAKADENGFPNYAGLASERFGQFCIHRGNNDTSAEYPRNAVVFYDEWEATAKSQQVQELLNKHVDKDFT
jgi:hypothetical protein